jgi:flagellin-like protein
MNIRNVRKRKAISPVLATVILIAITLVAGVAIAGFAFGLFGTLGTTANISVLSVSCTSGATGTDKISVIVTNTGGAAGSITGVSPSNLAGGAAMGATTLPYSIAANTATATVVLSPTVILSSGQTITGSLLVNGGSPVPFSVTCT